MNVLIVCVKYYFLLTSPFEAIKVLRFSTFWEVSGRRVNSVCTLGGSKEKYCSSFHNNQEKLKIIKENHAFLHKTRFDEIN